MPGPTDPRRDPARADFPAAHAVPLHARGVSCTPTVGVKARMGWHRSPVDGRRADPGALGRRRLDLAYPGRNGLRDHAARPVAERAATGTPRTANENLVTRTVCPCKRQVPSSLLVNLVKDVPHYDSGFGFSATKGRKVNPRPSRRLCRRTLVFAQAEPQATHGSGLGIEFR